jgi:hypothetical protein
MEQDEIKATRYVYGEFPRFKLTNGEEVDYQLYLSILNQAKVRKMK